ncbi:MULTISPECIES: hypothetical protein [unclassified Mycobacterium]|uniref:hypothetical protein n=1 Tax=unclassified Mycobacterium TaxID=2642494 RepID=UPI0009942937|nr:MULTISPECIES: hypothetical protein [unclassified Mycobacterium]
MVDARDAQRVLDAGVLSLGGPIDGLEADRDVDCAKLTPFETGLYADREEHGAAVKELGADSLRRIEAPEMWAALDNVLGMMAK